MLCYVDLEHESWLNDPHQRTGHLANRLSEKLRFEEIAGMPCLIVRYDRLPQDWLVSLPIRAILLSGCQSDWSLYDPLDLDRITAFIRQWHQPMIGFCGGHQMIAHAFGGVTGPMRSLRPDEIDPLPDYGPGLLKEIGCYTITLIQPDPVLVELPNPCRMIEDHYWAVKSLPADFDILATTDICPIQMMRHRDRLIYGTQFHPERYDESAPHGRQLLANFFQLVQRSHLKPL